MSDDKLSIEDLRQLIKDGKSLDPLIMLEAYAMGQDPRQVSRIYTLITELHEFTGGDIDPGDWAELVDLVQGYKYHPISTEMSMKAATTLAEYLHPKRKQVEKVGGNTDSSQLTPNLTKKAIEKIRTVFEEDF